MITIPNTTAANVAVTAAGNSALNASSSVSPAAVGVLGIDSSVLPDAFSNTLKNVQQNVTQLLASVTGSAPVTTTMQAVSQATSPPTQTTLSVAGSLAGASTENMSGNMSGVMQLAGSTLVGGAMVVTTAPEQVSTAAQPNLPPNLGAPLSASLDHAQSPTDHAQSPTVAGALNLAQSAHTELPAEQALANAELSVVQGAKPSIGAAEHKQSSAALQMNFLSANSDDDAILSTVTDTLKFVASGQKLTNTMQGGHRGALEVQVALPQVTTTEAISHVEQSVDLTSVVQSVLPDADSVNRLMETQQPSSAAQQPSLATQQQQEPLVSQAQILENPEPLASQLPAGLQPALFLKNALSNVQSANDSGIVKSTNVPVESGTSLESQAALQGQGNNSDVKTAVAAVRVEQPVQINSDFSQDAAHALVLPTGVSAEVAQNVSAAVTPESANEFLSTPKAGSVVGRDFSKDSTKTVTKTPEDLNSVGVEVSDLQVTEAAMYAPEQPKEALLTEHLVAERSQQPLSYSEVPDGQLPVTLTAPVVLPVSSEAGGELAAVESSVMFEGDSGISELKLIPTKDMPVDASSQQSPGKQDNGSANQQSQGSAAQVGNAPQKQVKSEGVAIDSKSFAATLQDSPLALSEPSLSLASAPNELFASVDTIAQSVESKVDTTKSVMSQGGGIATTSKSAQDVKAELAPISRGLSHPDWSQDVGERILWMNNRGISSAEIRLNPENIGPISVRIDMNQEQATVSFVAHNNAVRDVLEASIPKLREMFSAQQLNLADVNVSQQSTQDGRSQGFAQMTADASGQGGQQRHSNLDPNAVMENALSLDMEDEAVDDGVQRGVIGMNGTNGILSLYA